MSRQIQIRRGTADEHNNFTGAIGEITVDTTNNTIRVHDGQTVGGTPLAKENQIPNLSDIDYIVAWQAPTAENNYVWYRKYKSGAVDMGGHYTGNAATITLPVKLANNNYNVFLAKNDAAEYWTTTHLTVALRNTDSFIVSKHGDNANMRIAWQITNAMALN